MKTIKILVLTLFMLFLVGCNDTKDLKQVFIHKYKGLLSLTSTYETIEITEYTY